MRIRWPLGHANGNSHPRERNAPGIVILSLSADGRRIPVFRKKNAETLRYAQGDSVGRLVAPRQRKRGNSFGGHAPEIGDMKSPHQIVPGGFMELLRLTKYSDINCCTGGLRPTVFRRS